MIERLPVIGVMGSSEHEHAGLAQPLGRWLARQGVHLLTGGGGGVMTSVSRAFAETGQRRGRVIGILPGVNGRPHPGYPNAWIEIPIHTHLPLSGVRGTGPMSRNHINILSSDRIIALPGGRGTASEIDLALQYHKPVLRYLEAGLEASSCQAPWTTSFQKVKRFVLDHP